MDDIKFSVHVPVYNAEKYLSRCIDSILNQTYSNFELLLTDDGSTDSSGIICDEYAKKDARIRVFHNNNQGLLLTRRFSINKADGDFSTFVDSDDYIVENMLEKLLYTINEEKADIVIYNWCKFDENKQIPRKPLWENKRLFITQKEKSEVMAMFFLTTKLNSMCTKAIKTSILTDDNTDFAKIGFVKNSEDFIQSIYPMRIAERICYIPETYYYYYQNENSMTHIVDVYRYKSILKTRELAFKEIQKYGLLNDSDVQKFRELIFELIIKCVNEIANAPINKDEKCKLFDKIQDYNFYKEEIKDKVHLNFKSKFVIKHKYFAFITISEIEETLKKIKRYLNKV